MEDDHPSGSGQGTREGDGMEPRLLSRLKVSPIIAAVREDGVLPAVLASPSAVVFLLGGDISTVAKLVEQVRHGGKEAFVHFGLIGGLGRDPEALRWLAETARPSGIITTRGALIGKARTLGLATVFRSFLVDSQSAQVTVEQVRKSPPDFLEVLPGIAPEGIRLIARQVTCPIIAGGLIRTQAQVKAALAAGAVAVSTSSEVLWGAEVGYVEQPIDRTDCSPHGGRTLGG